MIFIFIGFFLGVTQYHLPSFSACILPEHHKPLQANRTPPSHSDTSYHGKLSYFSLLNASREKEKEKRKEEEGTVGRWWVWRGSWPC